MLKPCYTKAELIEELKCLALGVDQINAVILRSAVETINKYADSFDMVDARAQRLQKAVDEFCEKEARYFGGGPGSEHIKQLFEMRSKEK